MFSLYRYILILPVAFVFTLHFPHHATTTKYRIKFLPMKMSVTVPEKTKSVFEKIRLRDDQVGGAGGSSTIDGLIQLDQYWNKLKNGGWNQDGEKIVCDHNDVSLKREIEYDVSVVGGTLGIFYATALQKLGYKTCVIERGRVAGRTQEWNISLKELDALLRLDILSPDDINTIKSIEFNPCRVGFTTDTNNKENDSTKPSYEIFVKDILNLGIKPNILIDIVKKRFENLGGTIIEQLPLKTIDIYDDVALLTYSKNSTLQTITSRLVIDAMGNASPISKQIRGASKPDGICVVVGSCAGGYDPKNNTYSDIIYANTPITTKEDSKSKELLSSMQYFWEAFPAGSSPADRTTYLFTYMDANPERPSIMEIMEDYWELLPRYQGVAVEDLDFLRILYGMFPTYRDSPIKSGFSRIIQVGDASGIQSPLSFGGFGSLTRHLERITNALDEALQHNLLSKEFLSRINSYQPNLSACWMFQRSMSVPIGANPFSTLVVGTLVNSFSAMETLGDVCMRPFLQDVIQFGPLLQTLVKAAVQDPLTPFKIVPHVGVTAMMDFLGHMIMLGWYTFLSLNASPFILNNISNYDIETQFKMKRMMEGWKFGSGLDYNDHL